MRPALIKAMQDYRWLLDKDYPYKLALDTVVTRYMLSSTERLLLYRCIHSAVYAREIIRRKLCGPPRGTVIVDGYNVFATIYAAYRDEPVYLCDDGILRDLLGLHARVGMVGEKILIDKFFTITRELGIERLVIVLDANISHSGDLAAYIRRKYSDAGMSLSVVVAKKPDKYIIDNAGNAVVSSSDAVVLKSVKHIYDLAGAIIRETAPHAIRVVPLYREEKCYMEKLWDKNY